MNRKILTLLLIMLLLLAMPLLSDAENDGRNTEVYRRASVLQSVQSKKEEVAGRQEEEVATEDKAGSSNRTEESMNFVESN